MHTRRGLFFTSLGLTLLLILPMFGTVAFLAAQRRQQQALKQAAAQTEGPAVEPGAQSTYRLLLAIQQETPAFLLLRIDAPAQSITFAALPAALLVRAPAGETTLAECYNSAGPARAAQLLGDTVGAAADAYLAATPACWASVFADTELRLDTAALLDAAQRKALGYEKESVAVLDADAAAALLQQPQAAPCTALRAAVWAGFWRQNTAQLAGLPQAVKARSARTLTDLQAQQYTRLAQTLGWLAKQGGLQIDYTVPQTQPRTACRALTEAGLTELQALLG